jgi:hypothetical protein
MRTTLTIDEDLARQIDRLRREKDLSLRAVVNEALRKGLREMSAPKKSGTPFRTRTFDAKPLLANFDDIAEVLAIAEGDDFK